MQSIKGVRGGSRRTRGHQLGRALWLAGLTASGLAIGLPAPAADETPRERTRAIFDEIARADGGFVLRGWVNEGDEAAIPIGSALAYHFESERAAHLTVVHLDVHGVTTLLLPNGATDSANGDRVVAQSRFTFPDPSEDFTLRAEPPVGQELVMAVATAQPLPVADLGLELQPDAFLVLEAADAPRLAARLRDLYLETPVAERSAVRIAQEIAGRPGTAEYASVDIVDYFTTRTRSIERPRLDLHIHFATDSDALDAAAQKNLDEVATALRDPKLRNMRFLVAGHTDNTGAETYNASLSERRASRVVEYLTGNGSVDGERLEITSYGESRPLESNETREGRQMNRRVEFELIR